LNRYERSHSDAPGSKSSDLLGKRKTYQQIKLLECEAFLIDSKELVEKEKRKGEVAEKVQREL